MGGSLAGSASSLPQFWEFEAPASWKVIDFVSDLHLQSDRRKTFDGFVGYLRDTPAQAVFILGDLFEVWVGDDARHQGFEAEVVDALQEAATRRTLAFMAGNRDFLVGAAMLRQCGITALPDPTVLRALGERVLLTHGDALCLEDVAYQRFRAEVRTDHWCTTFLERPLEERRELAAKLRAASTEHQRAQRPENWADVDASAAVQWMHEAAAPVMVHGHTHRPASHEMAPGYRREVLTDWELDGEGPPRAGVLRFSARGLQRVGLGLPTGGLG